MPTFAAGCGFAVHGRLRGVHGMPAIVIDTQSVRPPFLDGMKIELEDPYVARSCVAARGCLQQLFATARTQSVRWDREEKAEIE
jgi:hypothetical protein